jgi:rhodanese-related sulfurtransferase
MTPEQLKDYMAKHEEGSYTLLDVRQPKEYEESHLPGGLPSVHRKDQGSPFEEYSS